MKLGKMNSAIIGRILTLDAILFNNDRGDRNILCQINGGKLSIFAIDMANALAGMPAQLSNRGIEPPDAFPNLRTFHRPSVVASARAAAARAAQVEAEYIDVAVAQSLEAARGDDSTLNAALLRRCRESRHMVEGYLEKIGNLP
jgi:hypothetical protein